MLHTSYELSIALPMDVQSRTMATTVGMTTTTTSKSPNTKAAALADNAMVTVQKQTKALVGHMHLLFCCLAHFRPPPPPRPGKYLKVGGGLKGGGGVLAGNPLLLGCPSTFSTFMMSSEKCSPAFANQTSFITQCKRLGPHLASFWFMQVHAAPFRVHSGSCRPI